ncbi:hypothetical protein F4780DRAFT_132379 [Xylariomycetidae sp. FL0641]|nr:hypothetical protein F4780DRAFT_132379 [Xylariomycetidae sp. FL0641]
MAMAENACTLNAMPDRQERTARRRPFATWVRKLASLKNGSSSNGHGRTGHSKRDGTPKASKKRPSKNNNPYPQSGRLPSSQDNVQSDPSLSVSASNISNSHNGMSSIQSASLCSTDDASPRTAGATSTAPTVSTTDHDATPSIHAPSHMASSLAGTSRTANGGIDSRRGGDSTFSSPAPSVRSLTTTLTTIQSLAPNSTANASTGQSNHNNNNNQSIQFSQPFPTASPASAIPAHLAPHTGGPGHPTTYNAAIANNLLTDNASILTLASSSKRRRRRSMDTDTNASVRALAPSSVWGGSRESLPLSILSANIDGTSTLPHTPSLPTPGRLAAAERTSIYSTTGSGVAPALPGDRNSLYAGKQSMGDAASVRSGFFAHGRTDSISGSGAGVNSPLASPMEVSERNVSYTDDRLTVKQ